MKIFKAFIVTIILVYSSFANATEITIQGFKGLRQEQSNWCWAASIQSVFLTKGLQVTQAGIVASAFGAPINQTAPGFDGTLRILNGISLGLNGSAWRVSASAGGTFPNANWLRKKLEKNEPVMIWYKDPTSNHSIVINGGKYSQDSQGNIQWKEIYAFDPFFDKTMIISSANIPKYVYGTFDIELVEGSPMQSYNNGALCYSQVGACPMSVPLPVGSACYCQYPIGIFPGIVNN